MDINLDNKEIKVLCIICKTEHSFIVKHIDYIDWCQGKLTWLAFPYLSPKDRDMLVNHVCSKCLAKIYV